MPSASKNVIMGQGPSNNASVKPAAAPDALSKIRALGRHKRSTLAYGPVVELRDHNGQKLRDLNGEEVVTEMPLGLFKALSTKKEIVQESEGVQCIRLPEGTLPVSAKELVARVNLLTDPKTNVFPMDTTGNLFKDLQLASAADFLGLSWYTQRMLNVHWQRLKNTVPTPTDVDVICNVHTPLSNKLFKIVSHDLAKLSWDGEHPNPTAFEKYLTGNPRFSAAVNELYAKWEASAEAFQAREERRRRRAEEQWDAEERARKQAMEDNEQRAKERVKYEARKKEEAETGKIVREKMRHAGSKFTAKEAQYIWDTFSKRVPVTAGS